MATNIELTADQISELTRHFDPAILRKMLRSALRGEARRIKKEVQKQIASATFGGRPLANARRIGEKVRAHEYRDFGGLIVSVSFRKPKSGYYTNRYMRTKPVPFWLDQGTKPNASRGKHRGHIEGAHFIDKAEAKTRSESVQRIAAAYKKAVEKQIAKAFK